MCGPEQKPLLPSFRGRIAWYSFPYSRQLWITIFQCLSLSPLCFRSEGFNDTQNSYLVLTITTIPGYFKNNASFSLGVLCGQGRGTNTGLYKRKRGREKLGTYFFQIPFSPVWSYRRKITPVLSNTLALEPSLNIYPVSMCQAPSWALGIKRLVPPIRDPSIP